MTEPVTYTLATFISDIMSVITGLVVPGVNSLIGLITGNPVILAAVILGFIAFVVGVLMTMLHRS